MRRSTILALFFLGGLLFLSPSTASAELAIQSRETVAFVGGTRMVRLLEEGRLEASMTTQAMEDRLRFRDLAWDGDTVYFQSTVRERWREEAFGNWDSQLKRVGARVVIAQFGAIESLDGPDRLDDFVEAYRKLIAQLQGGDKPQRQVILLRPDPLEWENDGAFAEYVAAVEKLAADLGLNCVGVKDLDVGPVDKDLLAAVREKQRLWREYWRPSNWKCLFGDDSKRIFSNAAEGLPSFKEEWSTYPALIAAAEEAIYSGKKIEPRPAPERRGSAEADPAKELAAFEVLDGYEVNLFADQSHGIANPLSVRWDEDGRMYVACSDVYPQIEPGVRPDDKVILLRDTDGDGRADESRVFARGLKIPTGMEVGADGIYVGQGTELLHIGRDGRTRKLLTGFGNGDSHQTSNSFAWGPRGQLWFCQGDGIESRVETPQGVSTLFQAGVFRLRVDGLQLDGLLNNNMGPGNPWGVAFDDFGQSFVIDGAGGVSFLTPGSVPTGRKLRLPRIGNPGGYCGIDCIGADEFAIGDYKKNQVSRFRTTEDGAGFKVEWLAPLLRSSHRNFRPIDVRRGPDGAIYIVDWYNPITCHQDDFYRHPTRDKTHGRIWRVAKKGAPAKAPRSMGVTPIAGVLEHLKSPQLWVRTKAKQTLAARTDRGAVLTAIEKFGADLREPLALMEVVTLLDWMGERKEFPWLLERLAQSEDHRARAMAARVAGSWRRFDLLEAAARDRHPRVRMEAVLACGQIPESRAILIAAEVAGRKRDRWINYALSQAAHHLQPHWVPAFRRGELDFGGRGAGLVAVLGMVDSKSLLDEIRGWIGEAKGSAQEHLARSLAATGTEEDLQLIFAKAKLTAPVLRAMGEQPRPGFDVVAPLKKLLSGESAADAIELAGSWRISELLAPLQEIASLPAAEKAQRRNAIGALGKIGGDGTLELLQAIAAEPSDVLQAEAIAALVSVDPEAAATIAAQQLAKKPGLATAGDGQIFRAFIGSKSGAGKLAATLGGHKVGEKQAGELRTAWIKTGLVDAELSSILDRLAGFAATDELKFDEAHLRELVAAGKEKGDRARGAKLFASARAGCAACHRVGKNNDPGGTIGPDLSAVGSGVPFGRIVTEVLWPARQVKAGYSLHRLKLKDGEVLQGYLEDDADREKLRLRDISGVNERLLSVDEVEENETIGSLMPATARSLTRQEQLDLFAYLFGLGVKEKKSP